jgi:hypothetical protein
MNGHPYFAQQVVADRQARLLAEADAFRASPDAPVRPARTSLVARLVRRLSRPGDGATSSPVTPVVTPRVTEPIGPVPHPS